MEACRRFGPMYKRLVNVNCSQFRKSRCRMITTDLIRPVCCQLKASLRVNIFALFERYRLSTTLDISNGNGHFPSEGKLCCFDAVGN